MEDAPTSESFRRWPTIAGALGGVAVSAGIAIPEVVHYASELTPAAVAVEVVLTNLFTASTAYLGTVLGRR